MVEILCPHCEEEIALDDDASGEFVCPHCEGEFEWNTESFAEAFANEQADDKILGMTRNQWALGCALLGLLAGALSVSMFIGAISDFGGCPEEFRIPAETFDGEEGYSCSPDYDTNVGGTFTTIASACCIVLPIGTTLIWFAYTAWSPRAVFTRGPQEEKSNQTLATSIVNGTFNVGVTGAVSLIGIALLTVGSLGLYFGVPLLFDILEPSGSGSSMGAIALVVIIPILIVVLIFCAMMVFIGIKYLITVITKNTRS